ncbi:hypothetical protein ACQPWW_03655 [Micromonospora sp. CA-240977]|uniref:hypothetical protein n=1 Tax=Micromonospora sp. CA-240977 TaxID=3239957 RepID=UPI003D93DAE7
MGWARADHLRTELILDAVGMVIQHRRPARDQLIHHSDCGTQLTSWCAIAGEHTGCECLAASDCAHRGGVSPLS